MNKGIKIRKVVKADLDVCVAMGRALNLLHNRANEQRFISVTDLELVQWMERGIANSQAIFLVASDIHDKIIGYVFAEAQDADISMLTGAHMALYDFYVEPEYRRHGVGQALMDGFLEKVGGSGQQVILYTMVSNIEAQHFFKKNGFLASMIEMTRNN